MDQKDEIFLVIQRCNLQPQSFAQNLNAVKEKREKGSKGKEEVEFPEWNSKLDEEDQKN